MFQLGVELYPYLNQKLHIFEQGWLAHLHIIKLHFISLFWSTTDKVLGFPLSFRTEIED